MNLHLQYLQVRISPLSPILIVKNRLFNNWWTQWWKGSDTLFLGEKRTLFHTFACFLLWSAWFFSMNIDFIAMKTVVIAYEVNVRGNEDGRQGKVLRSSRRWGGKKLLGIYGRASTLIVNIRFSGSWGLSHFPVFPGWADKTVSITRQVACHIPSDVKQKPFSMTKCKIKMNRNFRWNRKRAKKGVIVISLILTVNRTDSFYGRNGIFFSGRWS